MQIDDKGPTKEWWAGHIKGFAKGLEEARLTTIALAGGQPPEHARVLLQLAQTFHNLAQQ